MFELSPTINFYKLFEELHFPEQFQRAMMDEFDLQLHHDVAVGFDKVLNSLFSCEFREEGVSVSDVIHAADDYTNCQPFLDYLDRTVKSLDIAIEEEWDNLRACCLGVLAELEKRHHSEKTALVRF